VAGDPDPEPGDHELRIGEPKLWRRPEIVVDAALELVTSPPALSGRAVLDEDLLREPAAGPTSQSTAATPSTSRRG
jgi:hypothetical protein